MNTQSMGFAVVTGACTGIGAIRGDRRELVTIPVLRDAGRWQAYEAARQALLPNLSREEPADRHAIVHAVAGARNVED